MPEVKYLPHLPANGLTNGLRQGMKWKRRKGQNKKAGCAKGEKKWKMGKGDREKEEM